MNLLTTLLTFADGSRRREEDPITEIFAYLLKTDDDLRTVFIECLRDRIRAKGLVTRSMESPVIATQVTSVSPAGVRCRYDLVLAWAQPRLEVIVEVKVQAGLTWRVSEDDDGNVKVRHQIDEYLEAAHRAPQGSAFVLLLSPSLLDVGNKIAGDPLYLGWLPWQRIYDAVRAVRRGNGPRTAQTASLVEQFLELMEERSMAAPKFTFDTITSVSRYMKFRNALDASLTVIKNALDADGSLDAFEKVTAHHWQEEHERIGWRLFPSRDRNHFAFMGIFHGESTMHEQVPDLYFFLETRRGTEPQQRLDSHGARILDAVARLNSRCTDVRWGYDPGGYESIWATKSLVDVARAADPDAVMKEFFRGCLDALRTEGIHKLYFEAVEGVSPAR